MPSFPLLRRALLAYAILTAAQAAPAPANLPKGTPVGPQQASGSLRGGFNLIGYNAANPVPTDSTVVPQSGFDLAPGQDADPDLAFYLNPDGVKNFQPIRGSKKAPTDPGPQNEQYQNLNSDLYAPPGTDSGSVPNVKWPLGLSHNRHGSNPTAGWARQQNDQVLPVATQMAGVDMRLSPNAYRELHWHKANEWALILRGSARIGAVNEIGQTFLDDVSEGDVWFFPSGVPHTIQALENGVEFLLVFDDGSFDESGTFLASELFQRMPKSVLAKDMRTDVSAFDNLPDGELYIFPGTPAPKDIKAQALPGGGPAGPVPKQSTYSYHFSQQKPYEVPGGSVKIIDSASFPAASMFAAALVTIEPGAMREVHWHTTSDEWNYWLEGQGRITVFSAPDSSQTFDFTAGDVGYVPVPYAHYIENTGNTTVKFLEMLLSPRFEDISVGQWLGLTPDQVVKDTLGVDDEFVEGLPKIKPYILPGKGTDMLETNFKDESL